MIHIGHNLMRRSVQRFYYPLEKIPTLKAWVADIQAKVPQVRNWTVVDVSIVRRYDKPGTPWQIVGIFERDMTTLEAKRERELERAAGIREDGRREDA